MPEKEPWYDNEYEGKTLRRTIEKLNGILSDEDLTLEQGLDVCKTIGYLAVTKNTLAKATKEIDERISRLEQFAGLVKLTPEITK